MAGAEEARAAPRVRHPEKQRRAPLEDIACAPAFSQETKREKISRRLAGGRAATAPEASVWLTCTSAVGADDAHQKQRNPDPCEVPERKNKPRFSSFAIIIALTVRCDGQEKKKV